MTFNSSFTGTHLPVRKISDMLVEYEPPRRPPSQNTPLRLKDFLPQGGHSADGRRNFERKDLQPSKCDDRVNYSPIDEDFIAAADRVKNKNQSGVTKVSKPLLRLLKEAEGDKMTASGKRVPLSNVSSNTLGSIINLKTKGESKRFLKTVQSTLPDLC
ncbi:hypothetical protein HJC23_005421 [Cyclotella cryptica]|uniref:Uncharacterized protein n=1 Tax=Cyclotella cryptica TaxID=29204 RepID=A0ABD3NWX6_9STRA